MSNVDLSTTILGNRISFPVGVSPTAMQCMAHPDGEKATAKGINYFCSNYDNNNNTFVCLPACQRIGTCMTLSSWSTTSVEDVAIANGEGLHWFQLYIYKDLELTRQLVKRAEAAGYKAIAVTVDTPVLGSRLADVRYDFTLPSHLLMGNFNYGTSQSTMSTSTHGSGLGQYVKKLVSPSITWESIDWLRSITSLPIILKGILRPDDAREALKHDIQGIMVSNHGGRQLDTVPATVC